MKPSSMNDKLGTTMNRLVDGTNNEGNLDEAVHTLWSDGENMTGTEYVEVQHKKMKQIIAIQDHLDQLKDSHVIGH